MTSTASPKVWLVTGCSTGMGRCLVEYVLRQGHIVVATLRKPTDLNDLKAKYPAERLHILKLDVTKPQDISAAFDSVKNVFGRLDVVVNNAGYVIIGEVEGTTEDTGRALFDVNFWGSTNVSKTAVKFFREVNKPGVGGRLLNISSGSGICAHPTATLYSASKFALEGFTQALAEELDPKWNIKISLIEPGQFKSDAAGRSAVHLPLHPAYSNPALPATAVREWIATNNTGGDTGGDPVKGVAKWYELAQLPDPPMRLVLGKDAIVVVRTQITKLINDVDAREDWSNDLTSN